MFGEFALFRTVKHIGMESVDDKASLLFILDQTGMAQDAEMMRDIDDLGIEQSGQFADIAFAAAQAMDDAQSLGVRQSAKRTSAAVGL